MAVGLDAEGALVACRRFGLGARPGDLAAAAGDPRGFVADELRTLDPARPIDGLPGSAAAVAALFEDQERLKREREAAAAAASPSPGAPAGATAASTMSPGSMSPGPMSPGSSVPAGPGGATANPTTQSTSQAMPGMVPAPTADAKPKPPEPSLEQKYFRAEAEARWKTRLGAPVGLIERLVAFWSNHFAVSVAKGSLVRVAVGPLEREAIRPHVLGRFEDMLKAVEHHPAMLEYLDNRQSVGPNSPAGRNRTRGLNENLAREILELHTLGVDGGYTQTDVTAFARVITGWTIAGRDGRLGPPGTFAFHPQSHEPGAQTVIGRLYPQTGVDQGDAVLADLARRPATARHLAFKLARHFVADRPPPGLVDRLARVHLDSGGDLRAVTLALLGDDEAWKTPATKIRTPDEFLAAMMRASGSAPADVGVMLGGLGALGQPLWEPPGPNGFADVAAAWASPEAMKLRLDLAWTTAGRLRDAGHPTSVLDSALGWAASARTREAVAHAESRQQALALLFMSPEFQRR